VWPEAHRERLARLGAQPPDRGVPGPMEVAVERRAHSALGNSEGCPRRVSVCRRALDHVH